MFTATGLGEAHTWRPRFLQEVSASVLFRRHARQGTRPSGCRAVGAKMVAPVGTPGPPEPRSLSMALPAPGAQSLSHSDELRLTLPLSRLWERSDCLRSQLLQLWCRCRLNFLERLQDLPSGFRHWVCLRTPGLRENPATVQCLTVYKHVLISSGSLEAQLQS